MAVSAIHCPECLSKLLGRVYPPPFGHSAEECGTRTKVIDIGMETVGLTFTIEHLNKNHEFILGGTPEQVRVRFLPALGNFLAPKKLMSSWLAGSLCLDLAKNSHPAHVQAQGLLVCAELLRLGHSYGKISKALRCIRTPKIRDAAVFLALVMKKLGQIMHLRRVPPPSATRFLPIWASALRTTLIVPGAI